MRSVPRMGRVDLNLRGPAGRRMVVVVRVFAMRVRLRGVRHMYGRQWRQRMVRDHLRGIVVALGRWHRVCGEGTIRSAHEKDFGIGPAKRRNPDVMMMMVMMMAVVVVVAVFVDVLGRFAVLRGVAMSVNAACALDARNHPEQGRFTLATSSFDRFGIFEVNWSLLANETRSRAEKERESEK